MTRQQEVKLKIMCVVTVVLMVITSIILMMDDEVNKCAGSEIVEMIPLQEDTGKATTGGASRDWGIEDVEGFIAYDIPDEYIKNGGELPELVQIYTYCLCKHKGIRYSLILAMIERESGYRKDLVGDDGRSIGYMQIMRECHTDRMEKLGCTDLRNPYQNIRTGVDYMAELIERYGTIQDALAAYNYGETGAREKLWNNDVYLYDYNETIMNRMKEIEEELAG